MSWRFRGDPSAVDDEQGIDVYMLGDDMKIEIEDRACTPVTTFTVPLDVLEELLRRHDIEVKS